MPKKRSPKKRPKAPPKTVSQVTGAEAVDIFKKAKEAEEEKMPEQPYLFGSADMILNTLEMELRDWRERLEKISNAEERLEKKKHVALERIVHLSKAVEAVIDHAPKQEDPAVPESPAETIKQTHEIMEEAAKEIQGFTDEKDEGYPLPEFKEPDPGVVLTDLVMPGDTVETSYGTGPFEVICISGPFTTVMLPGTMDDAICPPHWNLTLVPAGQKRNKDGSIPKNVMRSHINNLIPLEGRILNMFKGNEDEVYVMARDIKNKPKKKDPF